MSFGIISTAFFQNKTSNYVDPLKSTDGNTTYWQDEDIESELWKTFFTGKQLQDNENDFDDDFYFDVHQSYQNLFGNEAYAKSRTTTPLDMLNSSINLAEVVKEANGLGGNIKKAFDCDGLHPFMINKLGVGALKLLTMLCDLCLESSTWPWTNSKVIFLKKEGKKIISAQVLIDLSLYHRESGVGKLPEKILSKRVDKFLQSVGVHDPYQEGFTKGKHTIRYLNRLNMTIKAGVEKKNCIIGMFIDFEKAFDSIWLEGLIKLFNAGVKVNVLSLINSCVFNCEMKLYVNDHVGHTRQSQHCGLPQGSLSLSWSV